MPRQKRLTLVQAEPETRLAADARAWDYDLDAQEKSPATRGNYADAIRLFERFCISHSIEPDTRTIIRQDVEWWLKELREQGRASSTRHLRYASIKAFFSWCEREGIIDKHPMKGMRAPRIIQEPVPILSEDQIRDIVKVASHGTDLKARRDAALVRLFIDSGARLAEIAGIRTEDWMAREQAFRVMGKGRKPRLIYYKARTATALDRYFREREKSKHADSPAFWVTNWGPMSAQGIATLLREIGARAGVPRLHAHLFRHAASHDFLARGGSEGDLMRLRGWSSREMTDRYASATQAERARDAFFRIKTLGDRV